MNRLAKRYLIDAMSGMAQGLFSSLLIGTIIKTLAQVLLHFWDMKAFSVLESVGNYACMSQVVGSAMAVGIGHALQCSNLVLFSLVTVGAVSNMLGGAGGPLSVLVIAIVALELGGLVSKKTKVDILVTPFVTIGAGVLLAVLFARYIGAVAASLGGIVMWATNLRPFLMGMIVSVVVGVALTLPISSAAICAALGLVGLAGGAAVAGCCAQMVGFAVISFAENGIQGLLSQGLGTSMLQMPNIMKKPVIWLPAIAASIVTGPISTCIFKMQMNGTPVSSGMGTCGLVGIIGIISGWFSPSSAALSQNAIPLKPSFFDFLGVILICIVLPALISYAVYFAMEKAKLITSSDLKLED